MKRPRLTTTARGLAGSLLVASIGTGPTMAAGEPVLVRDVATTVVNGDGIRGIYYRGFERVVYGGALYYRAFHPFYGEEPWVSDGTPEGTRLFLDVCPGACSSVPLDFTVAGGRLYFSADDGVLGREPWTSDGTAEGTYLLADAVRGSAVSVRQAGRFAAVGGRLFFAAVTEDRQDLWTSDGTLDGTERVTSLCRDCGEPQSLIGGESRLFFLMRPRYSLSDTSELWTSDGTAAGTRRVVSDCPNCDLRGVLGDLLFFSRRRPREPEELWRSDGTAAGTRRLLDSCDSVCDLSPHNLVLWKGLAYYISMIGPDVYVYSLYRTDGTRGGTQLLVDGSYLGPYGVYGLTSTPDAVYFISGNGSDSQDVWRFDGSLPRPLLRNLPFYPSELRGAGQRLFFNVSNGGRRELWTSDGVDPPEQLGAWSEMMSFTVTESVAFFPARDSDSGLEVWASDGTVAGTLLTADLGADTSSSPGPLALAGGRLVFDVQRGDEDSGLWTSDGTAEGTVPLGAGPASAETFVAFQGDLLFSYRLEYPYNTDFGLWRTDGSTLGTVVLDPELYQAKDFVKVGGRLLFSADDSYYGNELRSTDGSPDGTRLVKDINPGWEPSPIIPCCPNDASPGDLTLLGAKVVFAADDYPLYSTNFELWASDGTEDGTEKVAEICPGEDAGSDPSGILRYGEAVFFAADDGASGRELWRSDGTAAGTWQVIDLRAGPLGSAPHDLFELGERLYFFVRLEQDAQERIELWATSGTADSTALVHGLMLGNRPTWRVTTHKVVGDRAFFVAFNAATGPELWITDGTTVGTRLVSDLRSGPLGSYPDALTAFGNRLIFAADDGAVGRETWLTDGTADGTILVSDLAAGAASANPADFVETGHGLYFVAETAETGRELWFLPSPPLFLDGFESGDTSAWTFVSPGF